MKRAIRVTLFVLLSCVTFVTALGLGAVIHLRLGVTRAYLAARVDAALSSSLAGHVSIDHLDAVGFGGFRGATVHAFDPEGVRVLDVDDVDVSLSALSAARAVLGGEQIVIDEVHARSADISLDEARDGTLRIARTFSPRAPTNEPSTVRLAIHRIVLDHGWVHGPHVDADATHALGSLDLAPGGEMITIDEANVETRAMPRGANPRGHVTAQLLDTTRLHLRAAFAGDVGGLPVNAAARLDDDVFVAHALVPETDAERVRALVPEMPALHAPLDAEANVEGRASALAFAVSAGVGEGRLVARGHLGHESVRAWVEARHLDVRAIAPKLSKSDVDADAIVAVDPGIVRASGHVDPRGGHAVFHAEVDPHVASGEINGTVTSIASVIKPFIANLPINGHGAFRARARYDRDAENVAVVTTARFADVTSGRASLGAVDASGHAEGIARDPNVDVEARVERMVIPRLNVSSARARAHGRLRDAMVTARVAANGPFDLSAHVRVSERDALAIDSLTVLSDGQRILEGALDWDHGHGRVLLSARSVDLAQVRRTLGVEIPLAGRVGLDVDARLEPNAISGHATVDALHVDYANVHGLDAHVEVASLPLGESWSLVSRLRMRDIGWASVESMDLRPGGSPYDVHAWERATGSVHVAGNADLAALERLVDDSARVSGFASVSAVIRRPKATGELSPPDVTLDASTQKLTVTKGPVDLDLESHIHMDAQGKVDGRARLGHGKETLTLDMSSALSWNEILEGRLPDYKMLPFTASVDFPERDVASFCHDVGIRCRGTIALSAHVVGPMARAHGSASAKLAAFRSNVSPVADAIDAKVDATYEDGIANAKLVATRAGSTAPIVDAGAIVHVPPELSGWYASLDATMHALPMRAPPDYVESAITATVEGRATITDFHRNATAKIDLDASNIDIEGVKTDHARLALSFDGTRLASSVHWTSPTTLLDVRADGAGSWGRAFAPALDPSAPLTLAVKSNGFRLRNLMPLVPPSFGEMDGLVDADASGSFVASSGRYDLKGWAKLTNGDLQSSSIGELHDVQGRLDMKPDGSFELADAHLRGSTGLVKLTGHARMTHGMLDEIRATATIDRADKFPIVMDGDHAGDAWGRLDAVLRPKGRGFDVVVNVPQLHVVMPDQARHALQDLAAAKSISIGVHDRNGEIIPIALTPPSPPKRKGTPITITGVLGDDVQIERGTMLKVLLTGRPTVQLGDGDVKVTGQITLVRGTLEVQGKRFAIDRGTVTFTGDASNPTVIVGAGWTAADGTRVYADYVGPLKSGKLMLHSEPPRTQDEIVALIVFGSAEGPTPSTGGGNGDNMTTTAIGTGASIATQPLNKALEQLTHMDIRTRVDTSGAATKSEVEVQIAKNISAQVAYVLGLPPPGTEPDRTWLTLAWHMTAHWSVDFTIGDHGSSIIDALWRKRY